MNGFDWLSIVIVVIITAVIGYTIKTTLPSTKKTPAQLNLSTFLEFLNIFNLMSPFLVVFFFVMFSLFQQNIKGLVYLVGVFIAWIFNVLIATLLKSVDLFKSKANGNNIVYGLFNYNRKDNVCSFFTKFQDVVGLTLVDTPATAAVAATTTTTATATVAATATVQVPAQNTSFLSFTLIYIAMPYFFTGSGDANIVLLMSLTAMLLIDMFMTHQDYYFF